MATMTGARFLAETLHGYGVTHFFFMPVVIPEAHAGNGADGDLQNHDPR